MTEKVAKTKAAKPRPRRAPDPEAKNLKGKSGRRRHGAIESNPALRAWLREALQRRPAPTLDQLVEEAKGTGFAVGRTAVWKFSVAFETELARKELVLELARLYNSSSSADGSVLDIESALATMFANRIYAKVQENDKLDDEALKLLDAFRKLQSSSSQRERTRFHVERGVRQTKIEIRAQMVELFKRDPETLRKVLLVLDQAASEVKR